jgi:hypothetical protein
MITQPPGAHVFLLAWHGVTFKIMQSAVIGI